MHVVHKLVHLLAGERWRGWRGAALEGGRPRPGLQRWVPPDPAQPSGGKDSTQLEGGKGSHHRPPATYPDPRLPLEQVFLQLTLQIIFNPKQ